MELSLAVPGTTIPPVDCELSKLRLAPAWPTVAGTAHVWWATVAAMWNKE